MKKIYWNLKEKKSKDDDSLFLNKSDINFHQRVYNKYNLKPESFDEFYLNHVLDKHKLIRHILKEVDILLKPSGYLEIKITNNDDHLSLVRSKSQILHEVNISSFNNFRLKSEVKHRRFTVLRYVKSQSILNKDDSNEKWSFGIITNGKNKYQLQNLIYSIKRQNIPSHEILISGPNISLEFIDKNVGDVILLDDIRFPINQKKNKIIENCKYQNICILHDRYLLPDNWYNKFKIYGNLFEFLTMPTYNKNKSKRYNDWVFYPSFPSSNLIKIHGQKPYQFWSTEWFIQGGAIIAKKKILEKEKLLDLYWNELEDVSYSKIMNLKGYLCHLDVNNYLITDSSRLIGSNFKKNLISFEFLKWTKRALLKYLNVTKLLIIYYKNIYK